MFISSAYRKPHDLWIITFLTHTYTYHTCTCIIPLNILYQINYNTLKQRYKGQYRHQFNMRSMSHNAHEKNKCWWWVIWINSKYLTVRCSGGHIGFLTRSKSALYHKYLYHVSCHFKQPKLEFKMSIRGSGGHTGI